MSETLTRFYPFAGKYTNDIHIDCNDEGSSQLAGRPTLGYICYDPNCWNLRGRLTTPLPRNAYGNIIWNGVVGEHGADKVIDEVRWLGAQMASYDADYYSMSSMCNSGMYEADFGWGTPVWTCFGYLNNDVPLYANGIMLMDTSTGDGIEAWVTLSQDEMAILEGDPDLLLYASVEPSPLQV
ncbi:transferase, chloramphenicol acetyltransferase-like domain protein [Tanacetum coccineum]